MKYRNLAHGLAMPVAVAIFVIAGVHFPYWWVYVIGIALLVVTAFAEDLADAIAGGFRRRAALRAGLPYSCASSLAENWTPGGSSDLGYRCLERRARNLSDDPRMDDILPSLMRVIPDHDTLHEYVMWYALADEAEKQTQLAFWSALAVSSYPRDVAEELVGEHGFEVALKAVKLDLPAEYASSLV